MSATKYLDKLPKTWVSHETLGSASRYLGQPSEIWAGPSSAHPPIGELRAGWLARSAGRLCRWRGGRPPESCADGGRDLGLQEWAWHPPREAEVDSRGWLGGVEAGHSEAWASKPADLARHWLGETEDAPEELLQSEPADLARHWLGETEDVLKELLRTVQEPEEEAG